MAWVRTSIAMIGFGFTIYQFFERLGGMGRDRAGDVSGSPALGILLMLIGLAAFAAVLFRAP